MTQPKQEAMEDTMLVAVVRAPAAEELVSVDEIERVLPMHLQGEFHAFRHRYAQECRHQQVQLETYHETKDGTKFRVITEYHEVLTIVDLVEDCTTH